MDATPLQGMGSFGGKFVLDHGLVYGAGGGIINLGTTPPSQVAVLPIGSEPYGTLCSSGVPPDGQQSRAMLQKRLSNVLNRIGWKRR